MIAVALSSKARAVVRAHRDADRPTAEDRERVTAALRTRLGAAVLPLERPISNRLLGSLIQRRSATAFGLCVVGSVLFLARRPGTTLGPATQLRNKSAEAVHSSPSPATAVSSEPAAPSEAPLPLPRKLAPLATPHTPPKARAVIGQDTLAQEVLLLSSAMSQLSSGQAAVALLTLGEHQQRFSNGVLSEERNAAKARALCLLHRLSEGRAALALLAPGSPSAARAKQDCDSSASPAQISERSRKTERD
jgi:hypothetical protein